MDSEFLHVRYRPSGGSQKDDLATISEKNAGNQKKLLFVRGARFAHSSLSCKYVYFQVIYLGPLKRKNIHFSDSDHLKFPSFLEDVMKGCSEELKTAKKENQAKEGKKLKQHAFGTIYTIQGVNFGPSNEMTIFMPLSSSHTFWHHLDAIVKIIVEMWWKVEIP